MNPAHQRLSCVAVAVLTFSVTWLAHSSSAAAGPAFLKIGDVKGESKDGHSGRQMEILSWTWGESQTGASASAGRLSKVDSLTIKQKATAAGKPPTVTLKRGKSGSLRVLVREPWLACAEGTRFPSLEFGDGELTYRISDAVVTDCGKGASRPMESISLNFTKVDY